MIYNCYLGGQMQKQGYQLEGDSRIVEGRVDQSVESGDISEDKENGHQNLQDILFTCA